MTVQIGIFVLYIMLVLRKTYAQAQTVIKNFSEKHSGVSQKRKLGFHFERISNANLDLLSNLTTNKEVYHHYCLPKCSDSKLKRFSEPSKKGKSKMLKMQEGRKLDLFCFWYSKKDFDPNLVPAVIYRATKLTTKSHHVKNLTAKWIEMATKLNHEAF